MGLGEWFHKDPLIFLGFRDYADKMQKYMQTRMQTRKYL